LEVSATATTYCDGDQPGCEWNGTAHASTSTRSALSRAGGRVYDLAGDYGFDVTRAIGTGMPPLSQHLDEYATIPGGEISSYKVHPRVFTLIGFMHSRVGFSTLHDQIQALIDVLKPDAVPGNQPVILRYTEATVTKEITCRYEGGLDANWDARMCAEQRMPARFLAADPFWYEIGDSAAVLDTNDTATLRYLAGRLRSTRQWDDLGLTADPTANGDIFCLLVASDKSVYFGGDFDGIDNNIPVGGDYVIRYDPTDESFNLLVGASDLNNPVFCMAEGPDGTIYLGGSFTAVNGVATADYIVAYDPVADTWSSLGDPDSGAAAITSVWSLAFDSVGNLYAGGLFTNFADVANADYLAMWDGTAWTTPGAIATGGTGTVYAIQADKDDNIYIGGAFVNWAADGNADYLAWWNGTVWAAVNATAFGNAVYSITYDRTLDVMYITGTFTNGAGIAEADYIVQWNGQAFSALGGGIASTLANPGILASTIAPDGSLYIAGYRLETADSIDLTDSIARWNGSAWTLVDIDIPGTPNVWDIGCGQADPVVANNFDIFIGFDTTGAGYFSGAVTVTNGGTAEAWPVFSIERSGGTSARLVQIRNETTGKDLFFNYSLLDGEKLTIDTTTGTISSSFFGSRPDALLPRSNLASFNLQYGTNSITACVLVVGAPTITGLLRYRDRYWSSD
jgi:hypothetical protein